MAWPAGSAFAGSPPGASYGAFGPGMPAAPPISRIAQAADTAPPDTAITAGPSGVTDDIEPTFQFASTEPGSSFACRLDGGETFACSSPYTTDLLDDGPHTFEVRAIDSAGNPDSTPATRAFITGDPGGGWKNLPAPALGRTVNIGLVSGKVFVRPPSGAASAGEARAAQATKGRGFVPLKEARQIPVGSLLDTRKGTVRLASAAGSAGKTQEGKFLAGVFQVLQGRRARAVTELRLKGSSFRRCGRARSRRSASASRRSRRTVRRLRSTARGRFRTRGRHSAATVRGTSWLTADRCDGTLTRVKRGTVAVRDFRRKRTILVRAGKSYLARARR